MNLRVLRALPMTRGATSGWTEALSVHNDDLDRDHRHLLELLTTLESLSSSGSSAALHRAVDDLVQFSRQHFADEELMMLGRGYAGYAQHRRAHWILGEKLGNAVAQISAHRRGTDKTHGLVAGDRKALATLTRKWFVDHILTEDLPMTAALGIASPPRKGRNVKSQDHKHPALVA